MVRPVLTSAARARLGHCGQLTGLNAGWNQDLLRAELAALQEQDLDFDGI
jgi:hypothetical protein